VEETGMIPGCLEVFALDATLPDALVIAVVITRALILEGTHVPDPVPFVLCASSVDS
jgi:hypothetical protein